MTTFKRTGGLSLFLLLIQCATWAVSAESTLTNSPWTHIVMIGASASAGFTLSEPLGGTNTAGCRLSYFVDAALTVQHEPVRNLAHALFFLNPEGAGPMQINQAVKERPSLLLGVDFLFWFCYGQVRSEEERLTRLERGLKLLEGFSCPMILGDIPDASYATNTGIIGASQVPQAKTRAAANLRLREWAAAHPQVTIMPLADFMKTVMANQTLTIQGQTLFPAGKTRALLQPDQLHPNSLGAAALALGVLDSFLSKATSALRSDVRWDPALVMKLGCELAQSSLTNAPMPTANTRKD